MGYTIPTRERVAPTVPLRDRFSVLIWTGTGDEAPAVGDDDPTDQPPATMIAGNLGAREVPEGAPTIPALGSSSPARTKTVLLVDDNEDVQQILPEALAAAGYQVLQARNGVEGLQLARDRHPDLIIMDAAMPVLGGWDATRLLKLDRTTAQIPILAFTASTVDSVQRQALFGVSDGVLPKPSTPREVLAEVARWIGPAQSSQE